MWWLSYPGIKRPSVPAVHPVPADTPGDQDGNRGALLQRRLQPVRPRSTTGVCAGTAEVGGGAAGGGAEGEAQGEAMTILPISDVHIEFHRDHGEAFFASLPPADVLVIAGDLGVDERVGAWLGKCCLRYESVVYVFGNHEYYRDIDAVRDSIASARDKYSNLHALDYDGQALIDNRSFIGCTLWYRRHPGNADFRDMMNDFHIPDFERVAYGGAEADGAFLSQVVRPGDIVVTHMLPSFRCVSPKYHGSPLNAFFVHDVEPLIHERKPALWIHGHTHDAVDVQIGATRVFANPLGYPGENPQWKPVVIEVPS